MPHMQYYVSTSKYITIVILLGYLSHFFFERGKKVNSKLVGISNYSQQLTCTAAAPPLWSSEIRKSTHIIFTSLAHFIVQLYTVLLSSCSIGNQKQKKKFNRKWQRRDIDFGIIIIIYYETRALVALQTRHRIIRW